MKDRWGWTPLFYANSAEIAQLLIDDGADVNTTGNGGTLRGIDGDVAFFDLINDYNGLSLDTFSILITA